MVNRRIRVNFLPGVIGMLCFVSVALLDIFSHYVYTPIQIN